MIPAWWLSLGGTVTFQQVWDEVKEKLELNEVACGGFYLDDPRLPRLPDVTDMVEVDQPAGISFCGTGTVMEPEKLTFYEVTTQESVSFRWDNNAPGGPNWVYESGDLSGLSYVLNTSQFPGITCRENAGFLSDDGVVIKAIQFASSC